MSADTRLLRSPRAKRESQSPIHPTTSQRTYYVRTYVLEFRTAWWIQNRYSVLLWQYAHKEQETVLSPVARSYMNHRCHETFNWLQTYSNHRKLLRSTCYVRLTYGLHQRSTKTWRDLDPFHVSADPLWPVMELTVGFLTEPKILHTYCDVWLGLRPAQILICSSAFLVSAHDIWLSGYTRSVGCNLCVLLCTLRERAIGSLCDSLVVFKDNEG